MKKIALLVCLLASTTLVSFAQMKKGIVTYDMNFSSDNPEMAAMSSMMAGSKMTMYFTAGKSRADVSMGMIGTMATISDQKAKKTVSLVDMMGAKYATETPLEENVAKPEDQTVEITTETKEILGYTCTKALITSPESGTMTVWFTKDIQAFTSGQNYYNSSIPGFPLSMSISTNDITIDMVANKVEKKVDKKLFSTKIPEGYEIKTAEELEQMGGGM
jgi:GLPGLI family protein